MSAGLSLRTGFSAGGNVGTYTPMTPASATPSTASQTIAQRAYGISGSGTSPGDGVAAIGSVGVGVIALAALVYLYLSLPR